MMSGDIMRDLSEDEIWHLVEANAFGRLAFAVAGAPDIVPINYIAHERKLYFRSSEGSKLLGVTINQQIAFEIDEVEDGIARSVIMYGSARELTTSEELEWAQTLPLRPWVPTLKYHFVEISIDEASGREFRLGPDPLAQG
jgi:nitroimidazol reductase NimA-like FMN-containing flavoprotein (pyridoxamine 5'-phosphate oxidase superfamily)